jgi:hypothetical protein
MNVLDMWEGVIPTEGKRYKEKERKRQNIDRIKTE